MKNIFYSVILFFCTFTVFQKTHAQTVIPGKQAGDIRIGARISSLYPVCGHEDTIIARKNEKDAWENGDYKTAKEFAFQLKWDSVHIFENAHNPYTIWKVYTRKSKVVMMNLAWYGAGDSARNLLKTEGNIGFKSPLDSILLYFGNPDFRQDNSNGRSPERKDLHYIRKGISFIIETEGMINIFLYAPLSPKSVKKTVKKLNAASSLFLKDI